MNEYVIIDSGGYLYK